METNRDKLINNFIPDYLDTVYQIDNFTEEEISIILEYGERYGLSDYCGDLKYDLCTFIQDKIIENLIKLEFICEKDACEFINKYSKDILDFCVNDIFISRKYPGTYYIHTNEKSFAERIFEDNNSEFSDWESKIKENINYLEIINELNKNFNGLKFII